MKRAIGQLFVLFLLLVLTSAAVHADRECKKLPFEGSFDRDYRVSVCPDEREITYQASFKQPKSKIFETTRDLFRQVFRAVGLEQAVWRDASVELWLKSGDVNPGYPRIVAVAKTREVTMGMLMKKFHRGLSKETISLKDLSVFLEQPFPESKGYEVGKVRVTLSSKWEPDNKVMEQKLRGMLKQADPKSLDRIYPKFARVKTELLDEGRYCERVRSLSDPRGLIDSCERTLSDRFHSDGSVNIGGFSLGELEESALNYGCVMVHSKHPEVQICQTKSHYSYEFSFRLSNQPTLSQISQRISTWLNSTSLPESVWDGAPWELWLEVSERGIGAPALWAMVETSETNILFYLGSIQSVVTQEEVEEFHKEAVSLLGDDRFPDQTGYQLGEVLLWLSSNYGGRNSEDEKQLERLVRKAGYTLSIHPYTSHLSPGHVRVRTDMLDEFPFCKRLMEQQGARELIQKCRPPEAGQLTSGPTHKVLLKKDEL